MKTKFLQMKRAMNVILFVLLLNLAGMTNAFGQTQVATLQHGDDISVFYGTNAFVEAHTAAADGDIITLSSGTFVPTTVTKAITLRGAGCAIDTVAGTHPTIFGGSIQLNSTNETIPLTVEGILFTNGVICRQLHNPKFNKCNFTSLSNVSAYPSHNAQITNCIIDNFSCGSFTNTTIINSVIWSVSSSSNANAVLFYNSIMAINSTDGISGYNSILIRRANINMLSTCSFFNCIGINVASNTANPFGNGYISYCSIYTSYDEVFESFDGNFSFDSDFTLKDDIVTSVLGTDGTQVGVYGGILPYTSRPSYMVLKHCNVANKSTIDGKLSVDIEVIYDGE